MSKISMLGDNILKRVVVRGTDWGGLVGGTLMHCAGMCFKGRCCDRK